MTPFTPPFPPFARRQKARLGFTLMEVLIAMVITLFIITMLVYILRSAATTYQQSSMRLGVERQARQAVDTLVSDLENLVIKRDANSYQWLLALEDTSSQGPSGKTIPNTCKFIFFTTSPYRYNGALGDAEDQGGNVSLVNYRLAYRDHIADSNGGKYPIFAFYRSMLEPDKAIEHFASSDLDASYGNPELTREAFIAEHIYEFSMTFIVEEKTDTGVSLQRATIQKGGSITRFAIDGDAIEIGEHRYESASLRGVEVAITVLTDKGMELANKTGISRELLLESYSYSYTKSLALPRE